MARLIALKFHAASHPALSFAHGTCIARGKSATLFRYLDGSYVFGGVHGASDAPSAPVRRLPFARACASVHAKASFACLGISLAFRPTQQIGKGARNQRYCADWMLFISAISAQDSAWHISPKSLVLACSLSTAFIAHYNAPRFYEQVRALMRMRASCEARMLLLCNGEIWVQLHAKTTARFNCTCDCTILFGSICSTRNRRGSRVPCTCRDGVHGVRGCDALFHHGHVCGLLHVRRAVRRV